jgi:hypothetical protein
MLQRSILCLLLCLFFTPLCAQAKNPDDKYTSSNLADLTKLALHYNAFDLKDPDVFAEYLKITDCPIYSRVSNSPFKQQEIQQTVLRTLASQPKKDKELFFRLPITLMVSGYNFDTQSMPIIPESQFKRVNLLELTNVKSPLCNKEDTSLLRKIPAHYLAKLNFPISLYRIPLQRNIAETLTNKLDRYDGGDNTNLIYGYVLITIEAIQPEFQYDTLYPQAIVRAQVNAIDLYIDKDRTIKFKRLDFAESF